MSNKFEKPKSQEDFKKTVKPNINQPKNEPKREDGFERHSMDKKQGQSQGKDSQHKAGQGKSDAGKPIILRDHHTNQGQSNQKQQQASASDSRHKNQNQKKHKK